MKKLKPEWKEDAVDYYATLQVGHDASPEQIRSQRNKLAREAQQLSPSDSHEMLIAINAAYAVLSNSKTGVNIDLGKPEWEKTGIIYYRILEVNHDATLEDIKSARDRLAREAQQLSPSEGHELFAIINEAYAVLSDSSTRERYDAYMQRKFDPDWKL